MARIPPPMQISEIGGDHFEDLHTAQRAALDPLASHLANTLRDLLASGRLVNVNGTIIPNPNR